jgi:hypothetical protein
MPSITDIRRAMALATGLQAQDFDYVTEELLLRRAEASSKLHQRLNATGVATGRYFGNHFIANGFSWSWEDSPGGCGRTQSWSHTAQAGDSYRSVGQCPQGYRLFEIDVV